MPLKGSCSSPCCCSASVTPHIVHSSAPSPGLSNMQHQLLPREPRLTARHDRRRSPTSQDRMALPLDPCTAPVARSSCQSTKQTIMHECAAGPGGLPEAGPGDGGGRVQLQAGAHPHRFPHPAGAPALVPASYVWQAHSCRRCWYLNYNRRAFGFALRAVLECGSAEPKPA